MSAGGRGRAFGGGTVVNAIASLRGGAFALDLSCEARVRLTGDEGIRGSVDGGGDPGLIERCVELVFQQFGHKGGAEVSTSSKVPQASGLKSSSAAANAAVLAALDALDETLTPLDIVRTGVRAARDAKVTVTGAFDDACASLLGGVVLTDNATDELLRRETLDAHAVVLAPKKRALTAESDVGRMRLLADFADIAWRRAWEGDYGGAMTLNGLVYCAALQADAAPVLAALEEGAIGATISGTGPAYVALAEGRDVQRAVARRWREFEGSVITPGLVNKGVVEFP